MGKSVFSPRCRDLCDLCRRLNLKCRKLKFQVPVLTFRTIELRNSATHETHHLATLVSPFSAIKFASSRRDSLTLQLLSNVSIASIYREATFQSETISQTHLAETLEVLEEEVDWVRVRQEDGYEGWIARFFVVKKPQDWDDHDIFYPADQIVWIHQSPDHQSATLRDMTLLSGLPALEHRHGWVQVLLPDGALGWIKDQPRYLANVMDTENLVQTAFSFMGVQYHWGGRSPKGFDCSGFTQTCFGLNGLQLPRDAYLQAEMGDQLDNDFRSWAVGDLIFFSERPGKITHVAISLGDGDFIHASGFVKLNSLNPDHTDLYVEKYTKLFTKTMRII